MKKVSQLLIGNKIKIVDAKNTSLKGIKGKVIDETKNLLVVETRKGIKKLLKEQIKFRIENEGKERRKK